MVMEAPPSPQSVGREFVRQYYTLLNQAPIHLHRFYNNQSSFVHGGLDPPNRETSPMIGQKQIHQKIQQLNFRDCHAKITQVDAQATLGNGVVVQVTGELSNAGEPMRRFTQTFVLAAQSPKKYYVHNDIFRYQDVIVSDDECENECRSEPEEDLVQEHQVIEEMPQLTQQPIPYYNPNQALPTAMSHHHGQVATTVPHVLPPQPIATVNGNVHADDINSLSAGPIVPSQGQNLGSSITNLQTGVTSPPSNVIDEIQVQEELPIVEDTLEQNFVLNNQDPVINQDLNQETTLATEPKTYATLLKSGGGSTAYAPTMTPMSNSFNTKSVSPPLNQPRYENRDAPLANQQSGNQNSGPLGQRPGGNRGPRNSQPRQRQDSRNGPNPKNNFVEESGTYDDKRKAPTHGNGALGDSHQLFMGNLPHAATEDELREIFSAYGTIVDLRIHSKPGKMVLGVRYPPNYGFLTYDNQSAVQKVLGARPIYYPTSSEEGAVILNIEEKKTKDRLSYGGSRSGADNGGGIRNRDNGNRRPGPPRGGGAGGGGGGNNGSGGGLVGGGGTGGNRPNFNKIPSNRTTNSSNTYNNRR